MRLGQAHLNICFATQSDAAAIRVNGHDQKRKQRQDEKIVKSRGEAREEECQC